MRTRIRVPSAVMSRAAVCGVWLVFAAAMNVLMPGDAGAATTLRVVLGTDSGAGLVKVYSAVPAGTVCGGVASAVDEGGLLSSFFPFGPAFTGGVRVATGDVNGDGCSDVVVAPGPGGGPNVVVYDGAQILSGRIVTLVSFLAFDPSFIGGIFVATGNVDPSTPEQEVIVGADAGGGPNVRVFRVSGGTATQIAGPLGSFLAFPATFTGGVRVAACNLDGVAGDEVVVAPGPGGGPNVKVFKSDGSVFASFLAYAATFLGGVYVACGPVDADSASEIVTGPGAGGGPNVQVFGIDPTTGVATGKAGFLAYDGSFIGGVRVGLADPMGLLTSGPNRFTIVTGPGPGMPGLVKAFRYSTATGTFAEVGYEGFLPFGFGFSGGVFSAP